MTVIGIAYEVEREAIINTIGNLTLLTSKLNFKVSNGPRLGENGKRHGLKSHDVFFLNRDLLDGGGQLWDDAAIRARSDELAKLVTEIWPVPTRHRSGFTAVNVVPRRRVDLSELLSTGCLPPGMSLVPQWKKHAASVATLLSDGRLDVQGKIYASPSEAAKAIVGFTTYGWAFFLVDPREKRSLKEFRRDYLASIAAEFDEEDDGDGEDDSD